jgi:hypothetical protein
VPPVYAARFEEDENGHWTAVAEFEPLKVAICEAPTRPDAWRLLRGALARLRNVPEGSINIFDRMDQCALCESTCDVVTDTGGQSWPEGYICGACVRGG